MKRNKESKSRIRLFSTFHVRKSLQKKLDNIVEIRSLNYTELWKNIKSKGLHKTIFDLIECVVDDSMKQDQDWYINLYRNCYNEYINELHSMEYALRYSIKINKRIKLSQISDTQ